MSKGYDEISKQGWVEDAQPYRGRSAAGAAAVALANAAWRLNVADLVPAWTPKGKQLARERGANSCRYQGERFCRDISDGKHETSRPQ